MKLLTRFKFLQVILIGVLFLSSCEKDKKSGLPIDGDRNEYDTVVIGTQVWLKENLKTTTYFNGTAIPLVTDNIQWKTYPVGAYCWYMNDPSFGDSYGALYNWHAVNSSFLCPIGWHIPSIDEWKTLIDYIGDESVAGAALKEEGYIHWNYPNDGATNEYGFTAFAGGGRSDYNGEYGSLKIGGAWWCSTPGLDEGSSYRVEILYDMKSILIKGADKNAGMSVRCVKDN